MQCTCDGEVVFSEVGTYGNLSKYEIVGKCVKCGRTWQVRDITAKVEDALKATLCYKTKKEE